MIESPIPNSIIKNITSEDFAKIVDLDNIATFLDNTTPPDHAPPHFDIKALTKMSEKGEIQQGIFTLEHQLLAYWNFDLRAGEVYLDGIAVHPDYQNHGVGTFILKLSEQVAIEHQKSALTLTVDPFNGRGLNAYLKYGFQVLEYRQAAFGPKFPNTDRFYMKKDLMSNLELYTQRTEIAVNEVKKLIDSLNSGFIGTSLIRANGLDYNKLNRLVLQK